MPVGASQDAATYCRAIATVFAPRGLRVERCAFLAEGWDSSAWEVNGALVFRFPKRPEVAAWLERELRLLPELESWLPVPVPHFTHVARSGGPLGLPFAGYPKLAGVSLAAAPGLLRADSPLVRALGGFLAALHRFPLDRAAACGVPAGSWDAWVRGWLDFRDWFLRESLPLLDDATCAAARDLWDAFLAELTLEDRPVALVHHDLALEHILVDAAGQRVTGVIDWGDVAIGDPAIDFAAFARHYDEAVVRSLLAAYGRPVDAGFLRRAAWYGRLEPFHTLRFGLRIEDRRVVERGLAAIRGLVGSGELSG